MLKHPELVKVGDILYSTGFCSELPRYLPLTVVKVLADMANPIGTAICVKGFSTREHFRMCFQIEKPAPFVGRVVRE